MEQPNMRWHFIEHIRGMSRAWPERPYCSLGIALLSPLYLLPYSPEFSSGSTRPSLTPPTSSLGRLHRPPPSTAAVDAARRVPPRHVASTSTAMDAWLAPEPNRTPRLHCEQPPPSPNSAAHQRPRHRPRSPLMAAATVCHGRRRPEHLAPPRAASTLL